VRASLYRQQQLQISGCQALLSSRNVQPHLRFPLGWRSCTSVRSMSTTACVSFSLKPLENIQLSNTRYDTAVVYLTSLFVGFPCQKKKKIYFLLNLMFFYVGMLEMYISLVSLFYVIKFNVMALTSCTSNALDVYSGGPKFEYWQRFRLAWLFLWFHLVYSGKCSNPWSRPRQPSTKFWK
jgi:hypothetical protein